MTMIQAFPSGGSGKGGHTILDNGTAITERDTLNLIDFDIADDSTDEETDIAAHRLTSAELDDIVSAVPNGYSNQPIMFDERGTEYVIGKYIKSDGTIKKLYQKTVFLNTLPNSANVTTKHNISNLENIVNAFGYWYSESGGVSNSWGVLPRPGYANNTYFINIDFDTTNIITYTASDQSSRKGYITLQYTKTID